MAATLFPLLPCGSPFVCHWRVVVGPTAWLQVWWTYQEQCMRTHSYRPTVGPYHTLLRSTVPPKVVVMKVDQQCICYGSSILHVVYMIQHRSIQHTTCCAVAAHCPCLVVHVGTPIATRRRCPCGVLLLLFQLQCHVGPGTSLGPKQGSLCYTYCPRCHYG